MSRNGLGHQCAGLGVIARLHVGLARHRQQFGVGLCSGLIQQRYQRLERQCGLGDAQHGRGVEAAHCGAIGVCLQQLQQAPLGLLHVAGLQFGFGQQPYRGYIFGGRGNRQQRCVPRLCELSLTEVQNGLRVVDHRIFRRHLAQFVQLGLCVCEPVALYL